MGVGGGGEYRKMGHKYLELKCYLGLLMLEKSRCILDSMKFFSHRLLGRWNSLDQ